MLRLPLVTASRRPCVRAFATDKLGELLGDGRATDTTTSSLWGNTGTQVDDDLVNPPQAPEGSLPPATAPPPKGVHTLPQQRLYHLHVASSRNNTIITFTNEIGNTRAWTSAGRLGFKHVQRSGYEAGYQCAVQIFKMIENERATSPAPMKLEILFKGFGAGREALYRALMTTEGDGIRDVVYRLTDATPIKIGGTRARKARRL